MAVVDLNILALKGIPTIAALQQLSIREEIAFLTGWSESLHPPSTYIHTDVLEICNTDWLGRTKTMTGQSPPSDIRANSQSGGGC